MLRRWEFWVAVIVEAAIVAEPSGLVLHGTWWSRFATFLAMLGAPVIAAVGNPLKQRAPVEREGEEQARRVA